MSVAVDHGFCDSYPVCSFDVSKIQSRSVCEGNDKNSVVGNADICNPDAVFAVGTACAVLSGIAFVSLFAFDLSEVQLCFVRKGEHKFIRCIDFSRCNASAIRTVFSVFSCVAFFALGAVGTVLANDLPEVYGFAVGIGENQLTGGVD